MALDKTQKLLERIDTKKIHFKVANSLKFNELKLSGVKFTLNKEIITATYDKKKFKFDQIIEIVKNKAEILDISTDDGNLEDIFLRLTNK